MNAKSFALDILPKLKNVKTKANLSCPLQYVVSVEVRKYDKLICKDDFNIYIIYSLRNPGLQPRDAHRYVSSCELHIRPRGPGILNYPSPNSDYDGDQSQYSFTTSLFLIYLCAHVYPTDYIRGLHLVSLMPVQSQSLQRCCRPWRRNVNTGGWIKARRLARVEAIEGDWVRIR